MNKQLENDTTHRGGRPATGKDTPVMVRLQPDMLTWLDAARAKLDPAPSRPEMVRRMLERIAKK